VAGIGGRTPQCLALPVSRGGSAAAGGRAHSARICWQHSNQPRWLAAVRLRPRRVSSSSPRTGVCLVKLHQDLPQTPAAAEQLSTCPRGAHCCLSQQQHVIECAGSAVHWWRVPCLVSCSCWLAVLTGGSCCSVCPGAPGRGAGHPPFNYPGQPGGQQAGPGPHGGKRRGA